MEMLFCDRREAGRMLATRLAPYANQPNAMVMVLPRGGVPVGYEVAKSLKVPLEVLVVRKLGVPGQSEVAMGAISSGGVQVINEEVMPCLNLSKEAFEAVKAKELKELERRELLYRGNRPAPIVRGRTMILIDDGIATGTTIKAAILTLKVQQPARIIVAVPVAPAATCEDLDHLVDEVVCLSNPEPFYAVGQWYEHFRPTSDEEVRHLLRLSGSLKADPRN